ncbi:type I polyketide synthase [Amycolatopsis sp. NPDC051102]|uniref:type I polyketide synthase n=1 Tax=Amycolatopsis sp. NPDC051102 TaxID=3155163 RepID=UPI003424BDA8
MSERDQSLDIAVTGMAAYLPGIDDYSGGLSAWWRTQLAGAVHTRRYTREHLLAVGVPERIVADADYVPLHGHLGRWARFDHDFFGISPREAELIDPQHRLMLEVSWNALEDAGIAPRHPAATTGVFASMTGSGYLRAAMRHTPDMDPDLVDDLIHGSDPDFAAARIAYKLGLTGPALAVQTACSSSLVSTHLAVQALLNRDCDQAIVVAAGFGYPQAGYLHLPGGVLSPTGSCRPFDKDADGVVPGSGVACVVLRRLEDVNDADAPPHGVILGSAVNNDGNAKAGFYVPSPASQEAAIRSALTLADVGGDSVGYLESHGTGTPLGDPIEWTAASNAYRAAGARHAAVAVGALKASIGHLDAAAGLAGLIRAILVVRDGVVPPVAGFTALNPLLDIENSPLWLPTEATPLDAGTAPRRAGVSAFGIGGTNAHIVIEQFRDNRGNRPPGAEPRDQLVLVSAADTATLDRLAGQLADHLDREQPDLAEACATLAAGRTHLGERLAVTGRSSSEVAERLRRPHQRVQRRLRRDRPDPAIFVFPGQGTQRAGMAIPYDAALPGFGEHLDDVLNTFPPRDATRIMQALFDTDFPPDEIDQTALAQPSIFALQVAAARSLIDLGVAPAAVCGHSLGELSALHIAGVLSLTDAANFVSRRGEAMQECSEGAMAAFAGPADQAAALVERWHLELELSAVNGPDSCVLSGSAAAVAALRGQVGDTVPVRTLRTTRAFHSRLIEPAVRTLAKVADTMSLGEAAIPVALSVSGAMLPAGAAPAAQMLADQARLPVLFDQALQALHLEFPAATTVEVGPGCSLSAFAEGVGFTTATLGRRAGAEGNAVLSGLGTMWTLGHPVPVAPPSRARRLHLPPYPFFGPVRVAPETMPGGKNTAFVPPVAAGPPEETGHHHEVDAATAMRQIWSEILGLDDLSDTADFFALGGDSLLISRLIRRANTEFDIRLPVRRMLSARTLHAQVAIVREIRGG